jgi:hypothetical protein
MWWVGHRALESEGCEQSGNNEGEGVSVTGRLSNRNLQFSILASDLGISDTRGTPRLQYCETHHDNQTESSRRHGVQTYHTLR